MCVLFGVTLTVLTLKQGVTAGHIYAVITYLWTFAISLDDAPIALIDDVVVAIVHIRHTLNDALLQQGGHVGYSTHPAYQGWGIATRVLAFAVRTLNEMGVHKVLVTCQHDNLASARVIEKNGGILENILTKSNGVQVSRYWIGER